MSQVMTPIERVEAALHLQEPDRVPCCVSMSYWIARDAGISIAEYIANKTLSAELNHKMFERLGGCDFLEYFYRKYDSLEQYISMPVKWKVPGKDLPADSIPQGDEVELMPPEGYDSIIRKGWVRYIKEDLYPKVFPKAEIDALHAAQNKVPYDYESDVRYYKERNVYIMTGDPNPAMPPMQLLTYPRSMSKFMVDLFRRPQKVIEAMDVMQPYLIDLALNSHKEKGVPVKVAASRCSNGFLSPQQFEKFVFPYLKELVEALVKNGHPIFFHLDQSWIRFLPYFKEFPEGTYRLHLDGMTDMFKAKEILGDRMCFMGDLPAPLFKIGDCKQVEAYCKRLIDVVGKGGGLILAAGCGLPDDAKFENVKAMVDTARNYRSKDGLSALSE